MLQYMKIETTTPQETIYVSIVIESSGYICFPAEKGNPNYDAFLVQVDLTDEEVKALPTDEWFEV